MTAEPSLALTLTSPDIASTRLQPLIFNMFCLCLDSGKKFEVLLFFMFQSSTEILFQFQMVFQKKMISVQMACARIQEADCLNSSWFQKTHANLPLFGLMRFNFYHLIYCCYVTANRACTEKRTKCRIALLPFSSIVVFSVSCCVEYRKY